MTFAAPSTRHAIERARNTVFASNGTVLDYIETHDNNYNLIRFLLAASVILFHAMNRPEFIGGRLV